MAMWWTPLTPTLAYGLKCISLANISHLGPIGMLHGVAAIVPIANVTRLFF